MTELGQHVLLGCQKGDEECWRSLFANTYPLAKWVISHTLYQIDDYTVQSLAQDAMMALVDSIAKINDEQYLKRFVKRVARNKCIDYIRKHKEQFEEVPENIPDEEVSEIDDKVIEALHKAIEELKEPCNTLVRNRFLEGLSYKELAAIIGVEVTQIGVRISRCLGFLRTTLERMDVSWEDVL